MDNVRQPPSTKRRPEDDDAAYNNISRQIRWAMLTGVLVLIAGYFYSPVRLPVMTSLEQRLTFTLRWQLPSCLTLVAGISVVARTRRRSAAKDPLSGKDADLVNIHSRYVQNTMEQLVLSGAAQLILTTYLDPSSMRLIPILVLLFVIGRISFWIGYMSPDLGHTNRGFGFALTVLPTLVTFVYCSYCFLMDLLYG